MTAHTAVRRQSTEIVFMWVPAHVGVRGNERADRVAKQAVGRTDTDINIKLSRSQGKSIVWKETNKKWQQQWDQEAKGRHLYDIQSKVGTVRREGECRKEETVITVVVCRVGLLFWQLYFWVCVVFG